MQIAFREFKRIYFFFIKAKFSIIAPLWLKILTLRKGKRKRANTLKIGVIDKKEAKKFCKPYICWLNIKSKVLNKKSVFIEAVQ